MARADGARMRVAVACSPRAGEAFEVEFCDNTGATYGLHTLRANQIMPLHTRGQALRLRVEAASQN